MLKQMGVDLGGAFGGLVLLGVDPSSYYIWGVSYHQNIEVAPTSLCT